MRISELSRRSRVPVATIKYYLREGLVAPGTLTASTQAQYDETHLDRLRLVRALLGPGGLSIAQARAILGVIDDPQHDTFAALGAAQHAIAAAPPQEDTPRAASVLARAGWQIDPASTEPAQLEAALAGLDDAGFEIPDAVMTAYIRAAEQIAAAELAEAPEDRAAAIRYAVLGTVLTEPVILALRRLAHQQAAARRFGPASDA
ncbi:MerR family transcriptional regulator [Microbacterium sp. Marseille-Q6965]|uniref:MerR family transcriptional regulator n=1 Tax=Microbacterium sp. Marseille-Q6965 TaxID=2965072 RepID=UPI0021B745F4|nr:MerR family transcriptional regulator [Microbacterium sp. Marseille-Q6965]